MILGDGDIASVLEDRPGFLFFASGVSNSQETKEAEYKREIKLLEEQSRDLHLVYFSSLAIFYSDTRYTQHKLFMESLIRWQFPKYTIVRLGNIDWGTNPYTIINFFRNQLKAGKTIEIRDEYRYIVDKKEFLHWLRLIPTWNCEFNITGKRMKVEEIINGYCTVPKK